jgi:hypothetical protein
MGLDWVPIRKPKAGHEQEFRVAIGFLSSEEDPTGDDPLVVRVREMSVEARQELYESVSISPYETLGAPMVGRDAAADDFVRKQYEERSRDADFIAENPTLERFLEDMKGYYAAELMMPHPGVPHYQTTVGEHIDFRAKFLDDVQDFIGPLHEESFDSKLECADALDYADRLLAKADELADEYGGKKLRKEWSLPFFSRFSAKKMQVHILYSAVNWIQFWAERGHGYRADF